MVLGVNSEDALVVVPPPPLVGTVSNLISGILKGKNKKVSFPIWSFLPLSIFFYLGEGLDPIKAMVGLTGLPPTVSWSGECDDGNVNKAKENRIIC